MEKQSLLIKKLGIFVLLAGIALSIWLGIENAIYEKIVTDLSGSYPSVVTREAFDVRVFLSYFFVGLVISIFCFGVLLGISYIICRKNTTRENLN